MLRGKLERVQGGKVVGWIWDTQSDQPVTIQLHINGELVGEFVADILRRDLVKEKIGNGAHGFRVPLNSTWFRAPLNHITVYDKLKQRRLPQTITHMVEPETLVHSQKFRQPPNADLPQMPRVSAKRLLKPRQSARPSVATLVWDRQRALIRALVRSGQLTEKQVGPLIEEAFRAGRFDEACLLCEGVDGQFKLSYRVLNNAGRSYLQLGMVDKAVDMFEQIRQLDASKHGALFYLGRAYAMLQDFSRAYEVFIYCVDCAPKEAKYHFEAGRVAVMRRYGAYGVCKEEPAFLNIAIAHFRLGLDLDPGNFRMKRELSALLASADRMGEAYKLIQEAVEQAPEQASLWSEAMKISLRLKKVDEALAASQRALALDKDSDGAKFAVRILERLATTSRPQDVLSLGVVGTTSPIAALASLDVEYVEENGGGIDDLLRSLSSKWLVFDLPADTDASVVDSFVARAFPWAAGVVIGTASSRQVVWRRDFLEAIVAARALPQDRLDDLLALAQQTGEVVELDGAQPAHDPIKGEPVALLVSQYGVYKFGGAEQFLEQMARIYVALGYRVILVGTRHEHVGEHGMHKGIAYTFAEESPEELFRLAIEERANLVHVVSGLGFEIASALRFLKTRLVFGVHFWRELFYNPTPSSGYFPDIDQAALPRPDFKIILDDFAAIYSNSTYTRQVVERAFGVRTPVLYSLPDDVEDGPVPSYEERNIVLLANARADKGYSLLVEVAARLPHVRFLAIASQSGLPAAERVLAERSLTNVELVPRVDQMSDVYRRARAVLVPSFRFVETFSRVVIEAHRFGSPVVGSDRGNVPNLLTESGITLSEEPDAWAEAVDKLWSDRDTWTRRSEAALANSSRYGFAMQKERLRGVISSVEHPILVGVGSGLGNVIHTTPLIRNMARRLGRRIDVVVAGDYADLLFVAANQLYVNHVFVLNDVVLRRRYQTVFLTHSFGGVTPAFASANVVASRDWDTFTGDHRLHEAEFNLAAAAEILDISYEADDVGKYFLGDLHYRRPDAQLVGLHGGSKDGIWASKRWPGYVQLAAELSRRGVPVASFGTKNEYVEGTIDMTGGTIEEMARSMLTCSAFVANDSGVMNVANALGIPLLALFAPTNVATRGPLAKDSHSIAVEKSCAPCETHPEERKASFLKGNCRCIDEIEIKDVMDALEALLRPLQS